ncbi:MAG: NAD(P)/FAD-dependent oxidoreductase [Chloroflexi bacterium]|nr:NAD(P)/FAD-dependent oxidoreductase [Chloroflexota bacterium]
MKLRVVVLGAGFGGLELSSILSEERGDELELILIDKNDTFFFGYSKLDVMFGRKTADSVLLSYRDFVKPGVTFRQETVTSIDPEARRVITDGGIYEADVLVIALGADYDFSATPGLIEGENEFYSFAGAERLGELLSTFTNGHVLIGMTSAPIKCPPAPSEAALLLHDYLTERGVRADCQISLVMPFSIPIPPSLGASKALLKVFKERGITLMSNQGVTALDPERRVAILRDQSEITYDLFLGVPKHRAPDVVIASGMTYDGYIHVSPDDLTSEYPGVYAIGDVTYVGAPKAGMFAEGAAKTAAAHIIAQAEGYESSEIYRGDGICYVEFGGDQVARVEVDFLSDPSSGTFVEPTLGTAREKEHFGASRSARWFGA